MAGKRGFEIVSKYQNKGLKLPKRATQASAGYDFYAAEDLVIPSFWKGVQVLDQGLSLNEAHPEAIKPSLIPTGIKAYMPDDEFLMLVNRSSSPIKFQLAMPNSVGIIDADYYNNPNNEGEIFLQIMNYGLNDHEIKKGDRICQGIFLPYRTSAEEDLPEATRSGGFGSSGLNI